MVKIKTLRRLVHKALSATLLTSLSLHAGAATILLTNDDGLTSNILALYKTLKKNGHDVIVSIPCQGQSGMGGAILFLRPLAPLTEACLNNAGAPGDPAVGPVTRTDKNFSYDDFYYVNGTPVMATSYGLEVLAAKRWGAAPDLVLSGPNEGRNTGPGINSSGTVNNVQFAAAQGIPAIALSAGTNTASKEKGGANIADNPMSFAVAELSAALVDTLMKNADTGPLLPERLALNVNFPDEVGPDTSWQLTRIGTYNEYQLGFSEDLSQDPLARAYGVGDQPYPGMAVMLNPVPPTQGQLDDEAHVAKSAVAVSVMQVSFGVEPLEQPWLQSLLGELLD